jgi:hypothetical protein
MIQHQHRSSGAPWRRVAAALLAAACVAAGCSDDGGDDDGAGGDDGGAAVAEELGSGDGFVDADAWRDRQDELLAFATEELDRASVANVVAHVGRSARDERFEFDASSISPDDFADVFAKIDEHRDTSDFDMMRLVALWQRGGDDLDPALREAIEQRFLGFRYWYTDPLPAGVIDDKWFWSENHRIIVHTLEYLNGLALPDATFAITGEPGTVHAERGRERILEWLDEKARWGFSEWHSDVYYSKDIEPLLLLTEFGEDDVARRAAAVLDVLLLDLAIHQRAGNVGVTHGRSYMKDKSRAADQDVFPVVKLAFATSDQPYPSRSDAASIALALATRYQLPLALERVAHHDEPFVDRERMGAPLDLDQELSTTPEAPAGTPAFDDPEGIPFWWERGALTSWQYVPLTLATIDEHQLFETSLFQPFEPLADIAGGDFDVARQLAYDLRCTINIGVLGAVDTVTYRSTGAMLSTAQDHRPGCYGHQYHAWQATLDEDAVVFTTHPGNEPREGDRWVDADLYWSGAATMPRSAQHGAAAVHLYAPQYPAPAGPPLDAFGFLPFTHAYFPTERFDEVREEGGWTFGRAGDGFVALWSWRPTQWRTHDPAVTFTNGLTEPFDLVAPGGADNVWVVEVGDAATWTSFDDFVAAVAGAAVTVEPRPAGTDGVPGGFDVVYDSPAEGELAFGWTGPLTVDGEEVALHGTARFDNPFVTAELGDTALAIEAGGATLDVDLASGERVTAGGA